MVVDALGAARLAMSLHQLRARLAALRDSMPTAPAVPDPELDAADLPSDPTERAALRALALELMGDNVLDERRIALVDAVERRDGLTWAAAMAAARERDQEVQGINVKKELLLAASVSESTSASEETA